MELTQQNCDEFEKKYAKQTGWSLEYLHNLGGHGEPCNCEEENCLGWQMVFSQRVTIPIKRE